MIWLVTALHWLICTQNVGDDLIAKIQCDKQLKVNAIFLLHLKAHFLSVQQGHGHLCLDLLIRCEQLLAFL